MPFLGGVRRLGGLRAGGLDVEVAVAVAGGSAMNVALDCLPGGGLGCLVVVAYADDHSSWHAMLRTCTRGSRRWGGARLAGVAEHRVYGLVGGTLAAGCLLQGKGRLEQLACSWKGAPQMVGCAGGSLVVIVVPEITSSSGQLATRLGPLSCQPGGCRTA